METFFWGFVLVLTLPWGYVMSRIAQEAFASQPLLDDPSPWRRLERWADDFVLPPPERAWLKFVLALAVALLLMVPWG